MRPKIITLFWAPYRSYLNKTSEETIEVHENLTLVSTNESNLFFFEKMPCNYTVDVRIMSKISDGVWLPKLQKIHIDDTKWMSK